MAVNQERLALGTAALRSGQYQQGQGALHHISTGTWCPLGVLCDVAAKNGCTVTRSVDWRGYERFDSRTGYLPASVRDWYGFTSNDPVITVGGELTTVSLANDAVGASFEVIAQALDDTYGPGAAAS